jgi:hypothetical protein
MTQIQESRKETENKLTNKLPILRKPNLLFPKINPTTHHIPRSIFLPRRNRIREFMAEEPPIIAGISP